MTTQVILGDNCHIYNYEAGGISALGGLAFHVIHNEPSGELLLSNLQAAIRCGFLWPQSMLRLQLHVCVDVCM